MLGGGNTPSCRPAGSREVGVAHTVLCGGQELFLAAWEPTPVETRFSSAGSGPDRQSAPPRQCLPPITPHHRPLIYMFAALTGPRRQVAYLPRPCGASHASNPDCMVRGFPQSGASLHAVIRYGS